MTRSYVEYIARLVGVDAERMRIRIVVGRSPTASGIWFGDYDVPKVDAWFAANGGKREASDGATRWRTGQDRQVWQETGTSPFGALAPRGSFNVRTARTSFAWGVAGVR